MYEVKRTSEEVDEVLNRAAAWEERGKTTVPGGTYEQGVKAGIDWLVGESRDVPIETAPPEE